jgi:hypothetical protein
LGPSRLVTWAVAPDDFDGALLRATAAGAPVGRVEQLRRASEPGEVSVRITERSDVLEDGEVPFLVDWGRTPIPHETCPEPSWGASG